MRGGSPLARLAIVASGDCNLRCSYCRLGRAGSTPPWADVRAALGALLASPAPALAVAFTGGEPLLAFPLIRQAVRHAESGRRTGQALHFTLLTNGLLLDQEVTRFLVRHRFDVQVSLDGGRRAQDLRCRGTFERLLRVLARVRHEHRRFFESNVTVALTLTPENLPLLAGSIRSLVRRGVMNLRVGAALGTGRHAPDLRALERQFDAVFAVMRDRFERTGRVPLVDFRRSLPIEAHERSGWSCGAPSGGGMALDADGRRAPCLMATRTYAASPPPAVRPHLDALRRLAGRGHPAGPWARPSRALRLFTRDGGRYSSFGRCSDCRWLAECTVCPLASVQEPAWKDPFRVPDFLCAFTRTLLACREMFPLQPLSHAG